MKYTNIFLLLYIVINVFLTLAVCSYSRRFKANLFVTSGFPIIYGGSHRIVFTCTPDDLHSDFNSDTHGLAALADEKYHVRESPSIYIYFSCLRTTFTISEKNHPSGIVLFTHAKLTNTML